MYVFHNQHPQVQVKRTRIVLSQANIPQHSRQQEQKIKAADATENKDTPLSQPTT